MGAAAPVIKIAVAVAAVGAQIAISAMQPPVQGPRLGDLSVSAATYGLPIAKGWGVCRLGGNMIWSGGIKESSHTSKGGKGFGGSRQTTFSYSASFAFAFAAGPCDRILRIWADSKVVYDETGANLGVTGVNLRQYYGTEDQLPDSAIVADKGAANVPAFRGLVYIVAEDVPLEAFGNRIPNISAEVAFNGSSSNVLTYETNPLPTADDPFSGGWTHLIDKDAFDWGRNYKYETTFEIGVGGGIAITDTNTMQVVRTVTLDSIFAGTAFGLPAGTPPSTTNPQDIWDMACGNGTDLFLNVGDLLGGRYIVRVSPDTMKATGQFGPTSIFSFTMNNGVVNKVFSGTTSFETIVGYTGGSSIPVELLDGTTMELLGNPIPSARLANTLFSRLVPGAQNADGTCEFWWVNFALSSGSDIDIWKITVGVGGSFISSSVTVDGNGIIPSVANVWVQRVEYDRTNNELILWVTDGVGSTDQQLASVNPNTGTVNWTYAGIARTGIDTASGYSLLDGTTLGIVDAPGHVTLLDTRTGGVIESVAVTGAHSSFYEAYNARTQTDYTYSLGVAAESIQLNRGVGGPALLSDIVHDICIEAGLTADEIDTTALTDEVRGYTHVQEISRNLLTDLAGAFFFDGTESDYAIKFVKRGANPVLTVPYSDVLPPSGSTAALPVQRNQAEDIPRRVWVRYPDTDNNQQQGTQYWARSQAPDSVAVVNSAGEQSMDVRIVYNASEAKTLAKKRLLMLWQERDIFPNIGLPPSYMAIDPTDVINVTMRNGDIVRVRVEKAALGADLSVQLGGTIEDASLLGLTAVGDGGTGVTPTMIPTPYTAVDADYEMPLIRDTDDTGGTALREYAAFGAFSGQNFGGASLFVSSDNATWTALMNSQSAMNWGTAVNALPAPPVSPWITDKTNFLDVAMANGGSTLTTATAAQVLEGANPAILVTAAGDVEVIQYETVTAKGGNVYRLTGLLRGRRGSEWVCPNHAAGDRFVLLDTTTWREATVPLGWLGLTRYNKVVGTLDVFDAIPSTTRIYRGMAEKPYSPVWVNGTYDGSNNLILTWVRRTRIGGEWMDGVEAVPLSEATESYSIDIGSGGVVIRTLASVTPTVTYTIADQTTDGLDSAPKDVTVYQLSATVGRGISSRETNPITVIPSSGGTGGGTSGGGSSGGGGSGSGGIPDPGGGTTIPTGNFSVSGGRILDPHGHPWVAHGVNVLDSDMSHVNRSILTSLLPGCNFVRLACGGDDGGFTTAASNSDIEAFVNDMTSNGAGPITVMIENHDPSQGAAYSGGTLTAEQAWYSALATLFISNPYVIFATMNEPGSGGGGVSQQHKATHDTIRATGNNTLMLCCITVGDDYPNDASQYSSLTNVGWDIHFYNWMPHDGSPPCPQAANYLNQTDVDSSLSSYISNIQGFATSADGDMPVIIAECGFLDYINNPVVDQHGGVGTNQVVIAALTTGCTAGSGTAIWLWAGVFSFGNSATDLVNQSTNTLTDHGVVVATYI